LPATSQLEQFDIHNSYGHLYVQVNKPAIKPLGEAKPNTAVFRLLGTAMGFEPELFADSDEELARQAMVGGGGPVYPPAEAFDGIEFDRLLEGGPVRLNVPKDYAPFADGQFGTPSGKCEFFSQREADAGRDPLPHYVPPHEDPQTRPDLAAKYPIQLLTPPVPSFLNSSFVNVDVLRKAAGEPVVELHPADAAARGITDGQPVSVYNDRGRFRAKAVVGEYTPDGVNVNTTTSTALTDIGGGATFFDNLVEIKAVSVEQ
jgi:anaerobic selenocysteine-containing dehydrogenase